ncbi:hypothetical protein HYT23_00020 [Candidatus Pacearchaeota archaeon]|nr:hypothetical protein [Candidatus Pacearchaeota archaeon]
MIKRIALDAMTEQGNKVLSKAIHRVLKEHKDLELIIVGDNSISGFGDFERVSFKYSPKIILPDDSTREILNKLEESSTNLTAKLVSQGEADVGVSFANTKAVGLAVERNLQPINGLKKIPLAVAIPSKKDGHYAPVIILDVGATGLDDLSPMNLLEFGILGKYQAENFGVKNIKIGLLSNGTEITKGTSLLRKSDSLFLEYAKINNCFNYVGFIEGRDVFIGGENKPDVVVVDGFTGNVLLKMTEGLLLLYKEAMNDSYRANLFKMASGLTARITGAFGQMKKFMHPDRYGGASFLGLSHPFIKGHGASTSFAIQAAIELAYNSSANASHENILDELEKARLILPNR